MNLGKELLPSRFDNMGPAEKKKWLEDVADQVVEGTYHKPLSPDEKVEAEHELAETSIELSVKQEKYEEVKRHWNEEILKPLKETRSEHIERLKNGYDEIEGETYEIRDFDNNRVVRFAPDGEVVDVRRMTSSERQSTVQGSVRNIDEAR